jgi:bacillithiol biosynthesis cysteine-adding enzyme BshC
MSPRRVPLRKYPGLPPLFFDFLSGLRAYFPDPPTIEAVVARGRELLGRRPRISADAFRWRDPAGPEMVEALLSGRAVPVMAGHQVGLFTGPLYTVVKAFDAIRVAKALSAAGVPAVPVFYALTDDHDLEEIAKTSRPGPDGPEALVLEGADRSNRSPVGPLRIPEKVGGIVETFRPDATGPEAEAILSRFAARSAPGTTYADAFVETLFDLVPDRFLVLDPLSPPMRRVAAELFEAALAKRVDVERMLVETESALRKEGREVPAPRRPGIFPFFTIESDERRRVEDPAAALERIRAGDATVSADVLTRPLFKSFALPLAVSVLGPAEIAYHAQSLPLFRLFGVVPPVLLPRSFLVVMGPKERRAAEALGIPDEDLLTAGARTDAPDPPEAGALERLARSLESDLSALAPSVRELDPTLVGALENASRKATHQLEQMRERIHKAAEKKDQIAWNRRRRLETMVLPIGTPAERVYPPLVAMLAYGTGALDAIRAGATGSLEGATIVDLDGASGIEEERNG